MDVEAVEIRIDEALEDERRSGRLAQALRQHAHRTGRHVEERQIDGAIRFVTEYVRHVPAYLRQGIEAARFAGLEEEMGAVLDEAASYWALAEDILPDRLGLLGVLDDAYCSLALIQSISDRFELETGRPLFSPDLREANRAMRRFIGEPTASQLDMYVGDRLHADRMLQMVRALTSMANEGKGISGSVRPGIWTDGTVDGLVRSRLGDVGLA